MILKNVAGQGVYLYAYSGTGPQTNDQNNITGYASIDGSTSPTAFGSDDSNATQRPIQISAANMPGVYWQPLTQGKTNGNTIVYSWKSTTAGVSIEPLMVITSGSFPMVNANVIQQNGQDIILDTTVPPSTDSLGRVLLQPVVHTGATIPAVTTTGSVTNDVTLDLTQAVPYSNTANTTGDCFNAARVQGFGSWDYSTAGSTLIVKNADATYAKTFNIGYDANSNPISRS